MDIKQLIEALAEYEIDFEKSPIVYDYYDYENKKQAQKFFKSKEEFFAFLDEWLKTVPNLDDTEVKDILFREIPFADNQPLPELLDEYLNIQ